MGSKGSGGSSTVTQNIPADVLQNYKDVTSQAQQVAQTPYTPYGGQLVAGLNSTQENAINSIPGATNAYQPYFGQAQGLIGQGTQSYNPTAFSAGQVQQYENPYTQDVINSTLANVNQENAKQQNQLQGNAITSGAWGGNRADLARNDLARQQSLASGQLIAGLNNQNYQQALGQFNTANQTGLSAASLNNQTALSGAGLQGALGNYATQNQLAGAQAGIVGGGIAQQTAQNALNAQYQQYQLQQAYPFNTTEWLANIVEGIGGKQSQGSTTSQNPASNTFSNVLGTGLQVAGLFAGLKDGGPVNSYKSGGGIDGYAPGGNIPDIAMSYIPQTQSNPMMPQMKVADVQQSANDPLSAALSMDQTQLKGGLAAIKNLGKGIGAAGSNLLSGGNMADSIGYGENAAGHGTAAYDALDASDSAAALGNSGTPASLASLFSFKKGGGIQGYASGGWQQQPLFDSPMYSTPQSLSMEESGALPSGGQVGGLPLSATMNNALANELKNMPADGTEISSIPASQFTPMATVAENDVGRASDAPTQLLTSASPPQGIDGASSASQSQGLSGSPQQAPPNEPSSLSSLQATLAANKPQLSAGQALALAGAAMVNGGSRNALANIASGVTAGVSNYAKQKEAVRDYALKQAEAEKAAEQLAMEAARYNKQLSIEQQNADTNKGYKDIMAKTAQVKADTYQKMNDPAGMGSTDPDMAGLSGDDFISALTGKRGAAYANKIKSMAETGNIPSASAKTPMVQQELSDIYQYSPSSSTATKAAIQTWDKGKQGDQLRFLSNTYTHLDTLENLGKALDNGDVKTVNTAKNKFKDQFGYAAPINFNAAKQIVGNELVKSIVSSGGTLGDREEAQAAISASNSPAQLAGVVNTYKSLLNGQMKGMYNQFRVGTKQSDDEFMKRLDDPAKQAFKSMIGGDQATTNSSMSAFDSGNPVVQKNAAAIQKALGAGYTADQIKAHLGIQ